MKNRASALRGIRGFTIAELIVVVVIISLLVLIMTPVLTRRSAEAKITSARQDMQHLADSLERAHINTNYMFRIDVLNDGTRRDGIANTAPDNTVQGIADANVTENNLYGNTAPHHIFISLETQSFPPNQTELFSRVLRNETAFGWQGPYMNWHRDGNDNDWPDDPWGSDYLLFTINGVIYPPVDQPLPEMTQNWQFQVEGPPYTVSNPDGGTAQRQFQAANVFDRPTVLSLGPNGLPGNGTGAADDGYGEGDDIIYQFAGN